MDHKDRYGSSKFTNIGDVSNQVGGDQIIHGDVVHRSVYLILILLVVTMQRSHTKDYRL
jgi:hypothetical protein